MTASADRVDPTADRQPRRRPGRPARTTLAHVVDAAVALGLDRFTLTGVAAHLGVGESTLYNYVTGRAHLYAVASASVFAGLDLDVEADPGDRADWVAYVDEIGQRCFDLARRHPGLRDYVLFGPFEPSTIRIFETIIARVRQGLPPDASEHTAFVVASRPIVLSLTYVGDPVLEPSAAWLRRALLTGLAALVDAGDAPPDPDPADVGWRAKLSPGAG